MFCVRVCVGCICVCVCLVRCDVHYTGFCEAQHLTVQLAQTAFARINSRAASLRNNSHLFLLVVCISLLNAVISPHLLVVELGLIVQKSVTVLRT